MKIDPSGQYVMIIEYVTPINKTAVSISQSNSSEQYELSPRGVVTVRFRSGDGPELNALANLNDCPYTTPCRQVVIDDLSKIYLFNVQEPNNVVYLDVSCKFWLF